MTIYNNKVISNIREIQIYRIDIYFDKTRKIWIMFKKIVKQTYLVMFHLVSKVLSVFSTSTLSTRIHTISYSLVSWTLSIWGET